MQDDEQLPEKEIERRREEALKKMLNTPHKPHRDRITRRKKKKLLKKIKTSGQAKTKSA